MKDLNPHLDYSVRAVSPGERAKSVGDPRGIAWTADSRQALIDHLAPHTSDAALRRVPSPQSPEQAVIDVAYRSLYAENRLGNWAATVAGD